MVAVLTATTLLLAACSVDADTPAVSQTGVREAVLGAVDRQSGPDPLVIVSFQASWCTECRDQLPALLAFVSELSEESSVELLVAPWQDSRGALLDQGLDETVVTTDDEAAALAAILGVVGAPSTFVLHQNGQVESNNEGLTLELLGLVSAGGSFPPPDHDHDDEDLDHDHESENE